MVYYIEYTPERWERIKFLFKHYISPEVRRWDLFNLIYYLPQEDNTDLISNCDIHCLEGIKKTKCKNLDEFINIIIKDNMKDFKKSNLKTGMIVKLNNDNYFLVVEHTLIGISGQMVLGDYNEDLKFNSPDNSGVWDIKEVYQKEYKSWGLGFNECLKSNLILIWKREELKEYTMQEIADKFGIPVEQLRIKK